MLSMVFLTFSDIPYLFRIDPLLLPIYVKQYIYIFATDCLEVFNLR